MAGEPAQASHPTRAARLHSYTPPHTDHHGRQTWPSGRAAAPTALRRARAIAARPISDVETTS